ncbi:hypothetical protein [Antrihabitans spumae]|uniref:Head-to-tail adaptor n=1 Tax=Antrihabitans spumae TaxID=3373370 RepID=A0ABW7KIX8_9NOCA
MPFAEPDDIAEQWRPLTSAEEARAEGLLVIAERLIRRHVTITADDLLVAKQVSIEMVTDALDNGPRSMGPKITQATLDGASYTATVPDADGHTWVLTFTSDMRELFGLAATPGPEYYFGDCPQ